MASFSIDKDSLGTSQIFAEMEMDALEDPMDTFETANPVVKKAKKAKRDLEEQVKKLTLSVDTQKEAISQAKAELSEVDQQVGKIQARLTTARGFKTKGNLSNTERAFVTAIPGKFVLPFFQVYYEPGVIITSLTIDLFKILVLEALTLRGVFYFEKLLSHTLTLLADELELDRVKKDQTDIRKRVTEATRVLQREEQI